MKKRIWMFICTFVILACCMALSVSAATTRTAYCPACEETVTWQPVTYGAYNQKVGDPAVLKHKNSKFPAADANGNYLITEDMKEDVIKAVNWTLKNPWSIQD